jgi:hypothetical protein
MTVINVSRSFDTCLTKLPEFEPKLIDKLVAEFQSTQSEIQYTQGIFEHD